MYKYNIILYVLAPYLILKIILTSFYRRSGTLFMLQRLGYKLNKSSKKTIWIHAASVGETKIAIRLYEKLEKLYPDSCFLISSTTSSSKSIIPKISNLDHCYLPVDWLLASRRFIKNINPKICIIIETEIWPNMLVNCKKSLIPTIIVNGRLTNKTLNTGNFIKSIYKIAMQNIGTIVCKSESEKDKFINLGAASDKVSVGGNLKFSEFQYQNSRDNIINRKYILALSTHPDEERQIITEWLKVNDKKVLLVIAPRHPERLGDILADLPLDMLKIAIRSKNETIRKSTQIYIADTVGEAECLIEHCEFVFIGGSLVDHGGQNFLEAASYGKSIIVGPYMYNFIEETEEFLKKNAIIMVKNSNTLKHVFERLLKSKQRKNLFGDNAKKIMHSKNDIMNNYCKTIQSLIIE